MQYIFIFLSILTVVSGAASDISVQYSGQLIPSGVTTLLTNVGGYSPHFNQITSTNWNGTIGLYTSSVAGFYKVDANILWKNVANPAGNRRLFVLWNSHADAVMIDDRDITKVTGGPWTNWATTILYLGVGDNISIKCYQSQGTSQFANLTLGIVQL